MSDRIDIEGVESRRRLAGIGKVVLVGSGKGGVGKTLVSCGLALALAREGRRTGVFDIDIHGASVPSYLGVGPPVRSTSRGLEPKKIRGVSVMSPALFTGENPTPVKGAKKQSLIARLFSLTNWGDLDVLVVDLPPGAGDELLAAFSLFGKSELVLVTTPSKAALGVVLRLRKLAEGEGVRVKGVVVNMAYIKQGRGKVVYPFGKPGGGAIEKALMAPVIVEVPLVPQVSTEGLARALEEDAGLSEAFDRLSSAVRS